MTERRAPTTAKVQAMIDASGGGANVKSGQSTSPKATEAQVNFGTAFASTPRVVLTPTDDKGVWVTEITTTYFKWNNNSKNTDVTVYWIATNAGNS